jgi:hypothetical protein
MNPYSPIPRIVAGTAHCQLVHRILRPDVPPDTQRIDLVTTSFKRVSIIDSGDDPGERVAEGDTAVHVLWQLDERDAMIEIGTDHYPIAPGDTAMIPVGDSWQMPPHILMIEVSVRSALLALPIPPTHGDYHFTGYNRESRYPAMGNVQLSRWKLSEYLTLTAPDRERVLIGLFNDIALQHPGGVSLLRKGGTSVIRPETGEITLVPNGLSYVLVID